MRAIGSRPELAGLSEQARGFGAQAEATRAGIRPQVGFSMGFIYLGNNNMVPQGIGAASFYADWTLTDSGATRRRAAAIHQQERAAIKRREDAAADIALQVRTRWLDLQQARKRVPVAKLAIVQAEENINVITDRYRQQLSTYTEVLDAETRRIQSLSNFYNAVYDESLAIFRLRRAVGDLRGRRKSRRDGPLGGEISHTESRSAPDRTRTRAAGPSRYERRVPYPFRSGGPIGPGPWRRRRPGMISGGPRPNGGPVAVGIGATEQRTKNSLHRGSCPGRTS